MKKLYTLLLALMGIALSASAEDYTLNVTKHDNVVYYSNGAYSQPGAYDYYFYFESDETQSNPLGFPFVAFDLILPTNEGLIAGTYRTSDGTIYNELVMILNNTDYMLYQNGYLPHAGMDVTVTLEPLEGEDQWRVEFEAFDGEDTYSFVQTGTFAVEEDDSDPYGESYTYNWEPSTKSEMDITFHAPKVTDYTAGYGILLIDLDTDQVDANGRGYHATYYIVSDTPDVPAALYPINFTEAEGTVVASVGCTTDGSTDYPSFLRTFDTQHVYDTWYWVAGYLNVAYDEQGKMAIEGFCESKKGSHLTFRTENHPSAGLHTVLAETPDRSSVRKQLRDGRIEIRRDGRTFDALGIRR